jgi:isopentenyl-diphosphate Delta-isomerase
LLQKKGKRVESNNQKTIPFSKRAKASQVREVQMAKGIPATRNDTLNPAVELIYTSDDKGNLIALEPREKLHLTSSSKLHAAVIGMIRRKNGKYLLQWRSAKKLGGSRLDVSATTHVRKGETYETALQRSFRKELHIRENVPLDYMFDFRYTENLGEHKENEFCKVYTGRYDGAYEPDRDEIDSVEFMGIDELKEFVAKNEKKATKWLRETVKRM